MSAGASVALAPPPADGAALARFPRRTVSPSTPLYRVVRQGRGPWWFGASGAGRFDLDPPAGTCTCADDPVAALLEVVGPASLPAVSTDFLAARRLLHLSLPEARQIADATSRRAAGFGVTAEIGSLVPYDLPRAWAASLHAAGHGGIVYWLRHDPSRRRGFALFDREGERTDWPPGETVAEGPPLAAFLAATGIEVLPVPRTAELRFAPAPQPPRLQG